MTVPGMPRPLRLLLGALLAAAGAPGCLAHHTAVLRQMSSTSLRCPPGEVVVSEARTAVGTTMWRADCRGQAVSCAAAHNFDGPTHVHCRAAK